MDERHDVVIVGGGIMGATTLFEFARRGIDALLLEQDPAFGGRDSSKTAGIIRTHYSNPAVVRMAIRGREVFRAFPELTGRAPVLHDLGYAFLAPPDMLEKARQNVAMQRDQGATVEELPPDAADRFAPGMDPGGIAAIFYEPGSGYVEPVPAVVGFIEAATAMGAHARAGVRVRRLIAKGGSIEGVETDGGMIAASQVVLAAGAFSEGLARTVGVALPIEYSVEQELVLSIPADLALTASISNAVDAVYERPEAGDAAGPGRAAVLVGAGFPKTYPAGDPRTYPSQEALPALDAELRERLRRRQPAFAEAGLIEAKVGLYDITPDWHPLLGRVADIRGLLLITGGSGHGFKLAPAFAELVVADACGERVDYADIEPFSIARFERGSSFVSAYGGNRA
jgi:sarcosine oxidase subunit beta